MFNLPSGLSVKARAKMIQQPSGGYVNPKSFKVKQLQDDEQIQDVLSDYKIQGMAVDYLTRFMYGFSKEDAFEISLRGAEKVNELDNGNRLLNCINGLDRQSVINACKIVGYDDAYRNPKYFVSVDKINPNNLVIDNIIIMVKRCLSFFEKYGPVVKSGFTFEKGYTELVDSGDGDYITKDTLWDLKTSQYPPTKEDTLQLLMYYIMGIHSIHKEFQHIKRIGIFNPNLNIVYVLKLSNISNEIFKSVSHDVLGYKVPDNPRDWKLSNGYDKEVMLEFVKNNYLKTGFNPNDYEDGIYDITIDDYWSFYRDMSNSYRPNFPHTKYIKFLKHSGFIMFVSVDKKDTMSILDGGHRTKTQYPLPYYYEKMPEYGMTVLQKFSKYWDALYLVARHLQTIVPDKDIVKKEHYDDYALSCKSLGKKCFDIDRYYNIKKQELQFEGKVHGCIIDLDHNNHIYINPYDGTVTPYTARTMYEKYVYNNVANLIEEQRPEMFQSFQKSIAQKSSSLMLADSSEKHALTTLSNDEIDMYNIPVYDTSMYDISKKLNSLQKVYDNHLITVWYDNIITQYELKDN